MNIIRSYKLQKLGIAIDPLHKEIIDYIDDFFCMKNLYIKKIEYYPNSIFYFNKDKCIFEINNSSIYVLYESIWKYLQQGYLFDDIEIRNICKFWINKNFNIQIYGVYVEFDFKHMLRQ